MHSGKLEPSSPSEVRPYAVASALILTAGAVALQLRFFQHAGPLWRDEANSANLAALGSWEEILRNAHYDSFPLLWNLCLWVLAQAGWTADSQLRTFGLVAAWVQLGAFWWAARMVGLVAPTMALALYACSAPTVVHGTMFRGYGLGAAAFVLATGMLVRFVQLPSTGRAVFLTVANIAAVQSNFANGVLLAATHVAAALVVWRDPRKQERIWVLLAGALALAAASLGFCWAWIRYAFAVGSAEQRPVQLGSVAAVWWQSLGAQSVPTLLALWIAAMTATAASLWRYARGSRTLSPRSVLVLGAPIAVGAFLVYFWQVARLPSQEWHYLSLNALLALAGDVACRDWLRRHGQSVKTVALTAVTALGLFSIWQSWPLVAVRMSNVDLVASVLHEQARASDLVVVAPWYCGVSFQRYYRAAAPWITLPNLPDHRFHYHLHIRRKMTRGDEGIADERRRIVGTLQAGGRVWLVGDLSAPPPGKPAPSIPPGPHPVTQWRAGPYLEAWEMQIAALLRDHAIEIWGIELPHTVRINPWEHLRLTLIQGWR